MKGDLFFILLTIEYIVNALFYNYDTIHKINEYKCDFYLIILLTNSFYSTLISVMLNYY